MSENTSIKSDTPKQVENTRTGNTVTLRVPKPNLQVVVLGLVAFITLFQTFQLMRIGQQASAAPVKSSAGAATTTTGGSGSSTDVPQSMVGGC